MSDSDDMPPPLDDMSEVIERVKKSQLNKSKNSTVLKPKLFSNNAEGDRKAVNICVSTTKSSTKKKDFGGFQKGFLLGGRTKKKLTSTKQSSVEEIPNIDYVVKPTESPQSRLVMDDVQQAMSKMKMGDKSWVNDDILKTVESDDKLVKQLADPKFTAAIEMMKTDPKRALEHFKDDQDVADFFKKFYGILGNHFSSLEDKQIPSGEIKTQDVSGVDGVIETEKVKEDRNVREVLENPELRSLLEKPSVKSLIEALRENPPKARYIVNTADDEMKLDIQKLISSGLLNVQ